MLQDKRRNVIFAFLPFIIKVYEKTVAAVFKAAVCRLNTCGLQQFIISFCFRLQVILTGGDDISRHQALQFIR